MNISSGSEISIPAGKSYKTYRGYLCAIISEFSRSNPPQADLLVGQIFAGCETLLRPLSTDTVRRKSDNVTGMETERIDDKIELSEMEARSP
jgi:hypothetical protein